MIIIIVLEGKPANTEINFFEGLNLHLEKTSLKIYPFEKARVSSKRRLKIIGEIKNIIRENFQKIQSNGTTFFFIGDGDVKKAFAAMENTKKIIIEYIENKLDLKKVKIIDQILMDKDLCFEDSYKKISSNFFPRKSKKSSNNKLFNNFAEKVNWFTNNELDFSKIIFDMKRTKNPHIKIIKIIYEQEK